MSDNLDKITVHSISEVLELIDRALVALEESEAQASSCDPKTQSCAEDVAKAEASSCDPKIASCPKEEKKDKYCDAKNKSCPPPPPNKAVAIQKNAEKFANEPPKIAKKAEAKKVSESEVIILDEKAVAEKNAQPLPMQETENKAQITSESQLPGAENSSIPIAETKLDAQISEVQKPTPVSFSAQYQAPEASSVQSSSTFADVKSISLGHEGDHLADRAFVSAARVFEIVRDIEPEGIFEVAKGSVSFAERSREDELRKGIYESGKNDPADRGDAASDPRDVSAKTSLSEKSVHHADDNFRAGEGSHRSSSVFGSAFCLSADTNTIEDSTHKLLVDSMSAMFAMLSMFATQSQSSPKGELLKMEREFRDRSVATASAGKGRHADGDGGQNDRNKQREEGWDELAERMAT